ncbi:transposon Tf2-6 polyprotein [Trichonephila inaurata madagascariensis]|uniref:Transposon Tf2-6 polyprotein n=1 Tax=Trichonephila inaurata madagascariensis TaxID=2747483 RepID=A0A8X6MIR3_9ARAC|nr:transposon Tf2-6 polyprotein [Trichonephila inaurata madagascariensis]
MGRNLYSGKSKRLICSYCKGPGHYAVDCTKRPKCSKIKNSTDASVNLLMKLSRKLSKTMGRFGTHYVRWALLLEEYDYEIVHRSGQRMQHVDALSRYPVTIITSDTLTARLQRAQQRDENIKI